MKIRITKDEEKTTVTDEEGKVLSVWYKSAVGDKDIEEMIKKRFPKVEIIK
jgi:hypothetical protein